LPTFGDDVSYPSETWAQAIDGAWSGGEPGFVTQVLWVDERESRYHTPRDVSFRSHIKRV
jgi:hypothetical protein